MGWLEDYLKFTSAQESPERFHMWCGLSTLAATCERKVWMPRMAPNGTEPFRDYPGQLWIMLVAGAGKCKKSTAIGLAQDMMKSAGVRIYDGKVTPEALYEYLATQPDNRAVATIIASELDVFLSRQTYNEHLVSVLTKLYDYKDDEYKTRARTFKLRQVALTILAGTTPYSLGQTIPNQAQDRGFLSRWLFVYADKPRTRLVEGREEIVTEPLVTSEPDPILAHEYSVLHAQLVGDLKEIGALKGPFRFTDDGAEWYRDWYQEYSRSAESEQEGWPQRKPVYVVRLSMLMALSRHFREMREAGQLYVDSGDLSTAQALIQFQIDPDRGKALVYIGQHVNVQGQDKILDCFRKHGGTVTSEQLYMAVYRSFGDFALLQAAMDTLRKVGVLEALGIDSEGTERWKLLKEPY